MQHKIIVNYLDTARECAERLIGRAFTDEELVHAVGALDGAVVEVRQKKGADELRIEIHHPFIAEQSRWMRRDQYGDLIIFNHRFYKTPTAPAGIGLDSFQRQVKGARALGVVRLETFAVGSYQTLLAKGEVGYLVWAKFGFDAPLLVTQRAILNQFSPLAGVKTINALFRRSGGEEWWKRNGTDTKMDFDLQPQSSMMGQFRRYLRGKGRRLL